MIPFLSVPKTIFGICLMSLASIGLFAQPNYPTHPDQAELISLDLEHFVEAMNMFGPEKDSLEVLNEYYFNRGSMGLKEYVVRHKLTPELLLRAIDSNPDTYLQIESFIGQLPKVQQTYHEKLRRFHEVLPNAMYAPTYLLVGAHRGIAQASQYGQLVTITRALDDEDKLLKLIIHELSHFQQAMTMGGEKYVSLYRQPNNMLGLCLREGGAEFITSLVMNDITQSKSLRYLEENEYELKKKFQSDLSKQEAGFWLWETINQKEYPILLGYAMGFKICESFYKEHDNKEIALKEILGIDQPTQFLSQSAYFDEE